MFATYLIDLLNKRKEERQIKRENHEKLEGYTREHNQKLIDSVIEPWCGDKLVSAKEPFAIEHLQTGYPDIWKLWFEECNILRSQISKYEQTIKEYVKNKSYSKLEHIFDDEYFFETKEGLVSLGKEAELIYELYDEFADTGKLKDNHKIEYSKEIIETIIKDKTLHEMFEKANEAKKHLDEKINEFEQGLKKIVYDFEEKHIELKGTCKDCKEWHEKLKSLK